jgi:hypothetical protein
VKDGDDVRLFRSDRFVLTVIFAAWVAVSSAYVVFIGEATQVGLPTIVTVTFGGAAVLLLAFLIKPDSNALFKIAGAMSAVAIAARGLSIAVYLLSTDIEDVLFLNIAQIAMTVVLLVLFWWFWQNRVSAWHEGKARDLRS